MGREEEREVFCQLFHSPNAPSRQNWAWPSPWTPSRSLTWMSGNQVLGLSSVASKDTLSRKLVDPRHLDVGYRHPSDSLTFCTIIPAPKIIFESYFPMHFKKIFLYIKSPYMESENHGCLCWGWGMLLQNTAISFFKYTFFDWQPQRQGERESSISCVSPQIIKYPGPGSGWSQKGRTQSGSRLWAISCYLPRCAAGIPPCIVTTMPNTYPMRFSPLSHLLSLSFFYRHKT